MTDPVLAVTTPDGRFYTHPAGQRVARSRVPSITNVIGIKDKPGLVKWGPRKCGEWVADNLDALNELAKSANNRAAIVDIVRESPYRSTADSSGVGDVVHSWAERWAKGETIDDEELAKPYVMYRDEQRYLTSRAASSARGMFQAFHRVVETYQMEFEASELTVWSEEHEYAGSVDFFARVGKAGSLVIGDIKSGNNTYKEVAMQLAAGLFADYAFDTRGNQVPIPKAERGAILHVRPTKGRLEPVPMEQLEDAFEAFLGLRKTFEWDVTHTREDVIMVAPWIDK